MTRPLSHFSTIPWASVVLLFALLTRSPEEISAADVPGFRVEPAQVRLQSNLTRTQLVVRATGLSGETNDRSSDLTGRAVYGSSDPKIVRASETGRLLAVANGQAEISVTVGSQTIRIPVTVEGVEAVPSIDFTQYVRPILSKAGCNTSACHGSQYGKGGFKLSVFGYDPRADREAIVRDRIGRRINFIDPAESLFLKKPAMQVPHGGSRRLRAGSVDYRILKSWIQRGAPGPAAGVPKVTGLEVTPRRRVGAVKMTQQLRVEATYSDGTKRDVTTWAKFDTMDEALLSVTREGLVTAIDKGQAPIMVRFEGQARISMFVVPYSDSFQLVGWKSNNLIDELAAKKFTELGIEPSAVCDDATFLRRAYLDAIGTLPSTDDIRAFLDSPEPDKRDKLVDRLLGLTGDLTLDVFNDRYAAFWTLKWSDLIRNKSARGSEQSMWSMHNWIKESFRTNKPFDKFVAELVTAKGSVFSNGPANYFRINGNSSVLAESTAQLFLGVRLQCAKCHHHPFEKYSQADYNGFANFFSRVKTKNSEEFGLFGRESVVVVDSRPQKATPLGGEPTEHPLDLRIALSEWLTSPTNELFARSVVNRYMGYLLGRGLIEPIDDMRETNPATNVALLDALAKQFVSSGYDLKQLIRAIMVSRLYQLDSQPTEKNASDRKFYSHYKVKRLAAEPLLDAIDRAAGTRTKFNSLPLGTRAIELPDAEYPNYFLKVFAKPKRASVCECERSPDESLAQALHTLNGDILAGKIADKNGRIAKLLAAKTSHEQIVEDLYLATVSRNPTHEERAACREFLDSSPSPQECYEDILWALMNSKQFLFVR